MLEDEPITNHNKERVRQYIVAGAIRQHVTEKGIAQRKLQNISLQVEHLCRLMKECNNAHFRDSKWGKSTPLGIASDHLVDVISMMEKTNLRLNDIINSL